MAKLAYQCRRRIESSGGDITAVAFSKDGVFLAIASEVGLVVIYWIIDGSILSRIDTKSSPLTIVWQRDGPLYIGQEDGKVTCVEISEVCSLYLCSDAEQLPGIIRRK